MENPFEPCTTSGLASELWRMNCQIGEMSRELAKLRSRRDHVEETLTELMEKCDVTTIEGDHPTLSIVEGWDYDLYRHIGVRVPKLEFARETPERIADWAEKKATR